jgi:hypothetical protein
LQELIRQWWHEVIVPAFPEGWRVFAEALYDYECWGRQVYLIPGTQLAAGWNSVVLDGVEWYQSDPVLLPYDVQSVLENWPAALESGPKEEPTRFMFSARPGYYENLDNYEVASLHLATAHKVAPTEEPLDRIA